MPIITPSDLSPEVRAILGKAAVEGACVSDQPVCTPDKRVTAQVINELPVAKILPWRIANADKGHLIMIPGGPGGMIGGLLSQIDPAQYFSHMAIMTKDYFELRHATGCGDRIQKFPHRANSEGDPGVSLAFVPGLGDAPTDGFQEFALRYGWPGTITQSVDRAYLSWQDEPHVTDDDGNKVPDTKFAEYDTVSGEWFLIDALSFGPVRMTVRGESKVVFPIVVRPCEHLETDSVNAALSRVAEAAKELRGHYRFYGYTKAAMGLDPTQFGLVVLESTKADPNSPCTGVIPTVPVGETVPMVCSTFIWLAVQRANEKGLPKIILDGRPQRTPRPDTDPACACYFPRETEIDKIDSQTPDGLYFYGKDERLAAAQWLFTKTKQDVLDAISKDSNLKGQLDAAIGKSSKLSDIWNIIKVLSTFALPQASLILNISGDVLDEIVKILTDMPNDVANQIVNAFASDWCDYTAKDSDRWKTDPGVGYTVSPDNIVNSWASPTSANGELIHGLYGYNRKAIVQCPKLDPDPPPPSVWLISQGTGSIEGRVTFQGIGVVAAQIRVGCAKFRTTGSDGTFSRSGLPSGTYWATAKYVHPVSGYLLEAKGRQVEILAGGGIGQFFELFEPPDTNRYVWFDGHMDLVNRYAVGKDWWGHPNISMKPAYLGLDYFPDDPKFAEERAASLAQTRGDSEQVDNWGRAEISCVLTIQPDKSIRVSCSSRLAEVESDTWHTDFDHIVPPKTDNSQPGYTIVIDRVRSEMAWPVPCPY